jgi:Protein of unknown function (DUF3006)
MRVQVNRFEDNAMTVLLLYPEGRRSFDVPRELLAENTQPGDVFEVGFSHDPEATERMAEENKQLWDELLGRDDG